MTELGVKPRSVTLKATMPLHHDGILFTFITLVTTYYSGSHTVVALKICVEGIPW